MRGDVTVRAAYAAAWQLVATLRDEDGALVNLTGYSARFSIQSFDDSASWTEVMAPSVALGGAAGTFTVNLSGAQTQSLSAYFGSPNPTRKGRIELYATAPASAESLILHGVLRLLPAGEAVDPQSADVYEDTFSVAISALAPAGPAGPAGSNGAPGAAGDPRYMRTRRGTELPNRRRLQVLGADTADDEDNDQDIIDLDRVDVREFGATQIDTTTSASGTSGSPVVALGTNPGWKVGDALFFTGMGRAHGLSAPAAPTVIQQGTTGASTVSVIILWRTATQGQSAAGTQTVITDANATLSGDNYIQIWPESVPEGAYRADIYVRFGSSVGSHNWRGAAIAWPMSDGAGYRWPAQFRLTKSTNPTVPPGVRSTVTGSEVATANGLFARITAIDPDDDRIITLDVNVQTTTVSAVARTCNRMPFEDAARAVSGESVYEGGELRVPRGVWPFASDWRIQGPEAIFGAKRGGYQSNTSWLKFVDGFGLAFDGSVSAQQRGPAEQLRVGDRRQAVRHWDNGTFAFKVTAVDGDVYGFTDDGDNDAAWDFVAGNTTVDGGVTFECIGLGDSPSAIGSVPDGLALQWTAMFSPIGRHVVPADLQFNYSEKVGNFAGGRMEWDDGQPITEGRYCNPQIDQTTGKMYVALGSGTTGASQPSWGRVDGGTTSDNGTDWECVDIPIIQGAGITCTCSIDAGSITIGRTNSTGPYGAGVIFDGSGSLLTGGVASRVTVARGIIIVSQGGGVFIYGTEGQVGMQTWHTYNVGLTIDLPTGVDKMMIQDDSFYGNVYFNCSKNATSVYQTRRINNAQSQGLFLCCYAEGAAHDINCGILGGTITTLREGATGRYLWGGSPSQPTSYLGRTRDSDGLVTRQMASGVDYLIWDEVERRMRYDSSSRRVVTSHGSSPTMIEEAVADMRGRITIFRRGLAVSDDSGNLDREAKISLFNSAPTSGVVNRPDVYLDNAFSGKRRYTLCVTPDRFGYLGSAPSARANSTAYTVGAVRTQNSRTYVCVVAGTSASGAPASMASASYGDFITDDTGVGGTLVWQCGGSSQAAVLRWHSNHSSEAVALTDADQTLDISDGPNRLCNSATRNVAITLGTSNLQRGHSWIVTNPHSGAAFTWTFTNGGPGAGTVAVFGASAKSWAKFRVNDAGNIYLESWGGATTP